MNIDVSERAFEDAIEESLVRSEGVVAEERGIYQDMPPGGYRKRRVEDYDRTLSLIPRDVLDFVLATQPREWKRLSQHHGTMVEEQFLKRLASEIGRKGALDVLRNGIRDMGCKFQLAYFRPASGLNEETRRLHAANLFSVVRQLHYSSGPHHQDSGEAKIRESTAGVSRKPSSDGKARGCSSKQLSGLTAWNT